MSEAKYTMTEEEIKEQGIVEAEDLQETITDENYAEVADKKRLGWGEGCHGKVAMQPFFCYS